MARYAYDEDALLASVTAMAMEHGDDSVLAVTNAIAEAELLEFAKHTLIRTTFSPDAKETILRSLIVFVSGRRSAYCESTLRRWLLLYTNRNTKKRKGE